MKYFITEAERKATHSSCYFEFQKGRYQEKCWREDSVSLSDDLWDELHLSDLFGEVLPDFNYCGVTAVSREEWDKILIRAEEVPQWREIIFEFSPWAEKCFETYDVFSILGL